MHKNNTETEKTKQDLLFLFYAECFGVTAALVLFILLQQEQLWDLLELQQIKDDHIKTDQWNKLTDSEIKIFRNAGMSALYLEGLHQMLDVWIKEDMRNVLADKESSV